jgi:Ca2+:H+ antiporter
VHNPPGENNALAQARRGDAPEELKYHEHHLARADPEVNPWICLLLLIVSVGLMAPTVAFVSCILIKYPIGFK